jgi:D-alanyl-D-alanine carboxypeptidase
VAVAELGSGTLKYFPTTNNFALSGRADFLGGKTGTTPTAGGNLASAFMMNGRPVATVVFDAADRWAGTLSLLQFIQ